jgi:hypothetical protein
MALERIGNELVVKGAQKFMRNMRSAQKTNEDFQRSAAKGTKATKNLVSKDASRRVSDLKQNMQGATTSTKGFGNAALGMAAKAAVMVAALVGVLHIAKKVTAAFWNLGKRGAAAEGVIRAFEGITASAGLASQALLQDLRKAARGTVSDLKLMKTVNLALAGSTGEVAQQFGKAMPKLMEIARVQARATGQSVTFLYESLINGIKRSSPMLIDNTGLVVQMGAAKEQLAAKLDKTVSQLTAEQEKLALLNATIEAGERAIESYGSKAKTTSEYIASLGVMWQNFKDKLSVAVQPIMRIIVRAAEALYTLIIWPLENVVVPIVYELGAAFEQAMGGVSGFASELKATFRPAIQWIKDAMPYVIAIIRYGGQAARWFMEQVGTALSWVLKVFRKFLRIFFGDFMSPQEFFNRAAYTFGAFAHGILRAANTLIFPAIIAIAEFIANFLHGFSPPKKGPLSKIDEGGANVMKAWLEGFTGVALDPVRDVTAEVNAMLGNIGRLSHEEVEKRLWALDEAIRPFEERLKVVKARMDAILQPLNQIKNIAERQLQKALGQFFGGDLGAEAVRAMDRQMAALNDRIDSAQTMIDREQYQLSLAKLMQAEQRALLEIQQARTKEAEKTEQATAETEKATKETTSKAGKAAEDIAKASEGITPLPVSDDPIADFLGIDSEKVDQAMGELKASFTAGFGPGGQAEWAKFQANKAELQKQIGRIKTATPLEDLKKSFEGAFEDVRTTVTEWKDDVTSKVDELLDHLGGINLENFVQVWTTAFAWDGGVISETFKGFAGHVATWITEDLPSKFDAFSLENIRKTFTGMFGPSDGLLQADLGVFLTHVEDVKLPDLATIFGAFSLQNIRDKFTGMFGPSDGLLQSDLGVFITNVRDVKLPDLKDVFGAFSLQNLKTTFENMFGGTSVSGDLRDIIDQFKDYVIGIFKGEAGGKLYDTFKDLGDVLKSILVTPLETALNNMLNIAGNAVNETKGLIGDLIEKYNTIPGLPSMGDIANFVSPIPIPQISIPGARKGGLFGPGMVQTHRDELITPAEPIAVWPQRVSREIMRTIGGLSPQSWSVPASNQTVNNDNRATNTTNNTFNIRSGQSMRLAMAQARAW